MKIVASSALVKLLAAKLYTFCVEFSRIMLTSLELCGKDSHGKALKCSNFRKQFFNSKEIAKFIGLVDVAGVAAIVAFAKGVQVWASSSGNELSFLIATWLIMLSAVVVASIYAFLSIRYIKEKNDERERRKKIREDIGDCIELRDTDESPRILFYFDGIDDQKLDSASATECFAQCGATLGENCAEKSCDIRIHPTTNNHAYFCSECGVFLSQRTPEMLKANAMEILRRKITISKRKFKLQSQRRND